MCESPHVINFYQLFSVLFIADRLLQILPKLILPRIGGQPIDPHVVFRVFHSWKFSFQRKAGKGEEHSYTDAYFELRQTSTMHFFVKIVKG